MLDWKIIATAVIVGIIAIFFANSLLSSYFIPTDQGGNVSISLETRTHGTISANAKGVNITVLSGNFPSRISGSDIILSGNIVISKYSGNLAVSRNVVSLNGTFASIISENLSLQSPNGTVESVSPFSRLEIDSIEIDYLDLPSATSIMLGQNRIISDDSIYLENPSGAFIFSESLIFKGKAMKMLIGNVTIE